VRVNAFHRVFLRPIKIRAEAYTYASETDAPGANRQNNYPNKIREES